MKSKLSKGMKKYFKEIGSKGGTAKARKMTEAQKEEVGRKLAEARAKARKKKASKK